MGVIKLLLKLGEMVPGIRSYLSFLGLSLVLVGLINVPAPFIFASIIDNALPRHDQSLLVILVAGLLLVELLKSMLNMVNAHLLANVSERLIAQLRSSMFKHYLDLPLQHFLETPSGKMVNRLTTETESVGDFFRKTLWAVPLPLITTFIGTSVMIFWNWKMALYVLFSIPITLWATKGLSKRLRSLRKNQRDHQEAFQGSVNEAIDNIRVVKGFAREKEFDEELGRGAQTFANFNLHSHFLGSCLRSTTKVIQLASQYLFIIFGAWLVISREITLGEFFAFKFFQEIIAPQVNTLFEYIADLPSQTVSIERAIEILSHPIEAGLYTGDQIQSADGSILFKEVELTYPDGTIALQNINLSIKPGETLAIIGPSGSGKSSITALLLGSYVPSSGEILLHGKNINDWELHSVRDQIGIIYQDAELFNRSIRENMYLAKKDATDEEIWQALESAQAREFIQTSSAGLDTVIGNRGIKLSGGQKQRLSIARALLKNAPILILDEATSALDSISEKAIQEATEALSKDKTTIIIAHRLSTIAHADRIIVLDKGHIVENGTHTDLISNNGLYSQLYASQMDGFLHWERKNAEKTNE